MYNYNNILKCIETVKALNTTASKKADHFPLYFELKKTFDFCLDMTSCVLFEYDFCNDMFQYEKAMKGDFKTHTKKELDAMYKGSINYLKRQLSELLKTIEEPA